MKVTIDNYFDRQSELLNAINSSASLIAAHDFLAKATSGGKDLSAYHKSDKIKHTIDLYFDKLTTLSNKQLKTPVPQKPEKPAAKKKAPAARKVTTLHKELPSADTSPAPVMVSRLPDELVIIRRFVNMNGKEKTKEQILNLLNAVQKAIVEKRIRKTSQWAEHIRYIQDKLIETYNGMKATISVALSEKTLERFREFITSEKVLSSVAFIKRYIGMHAKTGMKDKGKKLLADLDKAIEKGKIPGNDPYGAELDEIRKNLQGFIANKNAKVLDIETASLSGLQGIVSGLGCACQDHSLNGSGEPAQVISSVDFVQKEFPTIGLSGKWLDFMGDPSPGFTAMVSARPKYGKSTLCANFAGYLAREHGPVLFVAKEEGFSKTLRDKLEAVKHPRLMVASSLPADLSPYQYIFLDSITRLGLSPDDLRRLKATNAGKSFVYVFQVTKDGRFRGANDFQHDVDVVIELPQPGRAIQFGRFNQGGELDIFKTID